MLPSIATETLKIYYPQTVVARGTVEYQPRVDATHMLTVSGCSIQPTTTSELLSEQREQTMTLMTVWMPEAQWARIVAGGTTRQLVIEWHGRQFLQYGSVMEWASPTGALGHVQLYVREWEG